MEELDYLQESKLIYMKENTNKCIHGLTLRRRKKNDVLQISAITRIKFIKYEIEFKYTSVHRGKVV